MSVKKVGLLGLGIIVLLAMVAVIAVAGRDGGRRDKMVVMADGHERLTVSMGEGPVVRIVRLGHEDAEDDVVEIDLSQLGDIIGDALADVDEALSELSNLDIDLDLSDSGDLWIRDGEDEIYVNVEEIAGQVEAVLSETFARMSRAWDDHAEVRPEGAEPTDLLDAEAGELQREVERLRQEMADLQKELRRLRQEQRH